MPRMSEFTPYFRAYDLSRIPSSEVVHSCEAAAYKIALPQTPERLQIQQILALATKADRLHKVLGEVATRGLVNRILDKLGEIDGLVMRYVEEYQDSVDKRCAQFAFDGEPWIVNVMPSDFWNNTTGYLIAKGYEIVTDAPLPGDIIAYQDIDEANNATTKHFGIYLGMRGEEVWAVSKNSVSHVLEHFLHTVSADWGTQAVFYRSVEKA